MILDSRSDLFRVEIPKVFLPDFIKNKYSPYIHRMPTIISDASDAIIGQELPAMIEDGITSFKIYMTYDDLKLDDYDILNVLAAARREQAMVMVHAENHDVIKWITEKLLDQGLGDPKYHAIAHASLAEKEATHRAITLAELLDTPMLIVHVSSEAALNEIRRARQATARSAGCQTDAHIDTVTL